MPQISGTSVASKLLKTLNDNGASVMSLGQEIESADLSYLDSDSLRKIYVKDSDFPVMKFHVQGIKCGRCAEKIEALQDNNPQIKSIRLNISNHQLQVELSKKADSFSDIISQIQGKGFKLTPIENSDDLLELNKKEERAQLFRLAVAGLCAGNIMMFSFANYFGAGDNFKSLFSWLSFSLYLPVLTYAARPFYQGFLAAIKERKLSVDGPLTVASIGGFLFSTYHLITGSDQIYFDSLSGFLFLILLSRFFQSQLQKRFLSFRGKMPIDSFSRARRMIDGGADWVNTEALQLGHQICVKENEVLPVDGRLCHESALFSTAYLTGESQPSLRHPGSLILAGSILKSKTAVFEVQTLSKDTMFGKLVKQVMDHEAMSGRTPIQNLSDIFSQILLVTVFLTALVFIALNWSEPAMAFERALALIILACPCAMAFGTPLALAFSMRQAFEKGFLIRSPDVFEKISKIKNVIFDKTGTLTGQSLGIQRSLPDNISSEKINLILSLENISNGIYANAFREFFKYQKHKNLEIICPVEKIGFGVSGYFDGHFYELKRPQVDSSEKTVGFFVDGAIDTVFFFSEQIDYQAIQLSQSLQKMNIQQFILSGDSAPQVDRIAKELKIPMSHCTSRACPAEKAAKVRLLSNSMMVGDGVNDALAFQAANVGVAVQGSVEIALKSADVYLLSPDISRIQDLFLISDRALKLIKRNLWISLFYNLLAGTAALCGLINPFIAALLMPISSGFILLSTWWGSQR